MTRALVRLGLRRPPPKPPSGEAERLLRIYAETMAELEELRRERPPARRRVA